MQKLSLDAVAKEQLKRAAAGTNGRASTTVCGGHERALRQTVMALCAGASLAEHENPGEATLHVLRGRIRLVAGEDAWDGRSGDLIVIPDARHSIEAIEDSAVVLTVVKRA